MDLLLRDLAMYWASISEYFAFDHARLAEPDMVIRLTIQGALLIGSAFFFRF